MMKYLFLNVKCSKLRTLPAHPSVKKRVVQRYYAGLLVYSSIYLGWLGIKSRALE